MTGLQHSTQATSPDTRRVLVDGLNVAHWCGRSPQLRLPLALLAALQRQGVAACLYFDASARHRFADDADSYAALRQLGHFCIEVPAGRTADGALLRDARATGACIVSRDHFSDQRRRYRKLIDEPGRLLAGFVRDNALHLPALALQAPLPTHAAEALALLQRSQACVTASA